MSRRRQHTRGEPQRTGDAYGPQHAKALRIESINLQRSQAAAARNGLDLPIEIPALWQRIARDRNARDHRDILPGLHGVAGNHRVGGRELHILRQSHAAALDGQRDVYKRQAMERTLLGEFKYHSNIALLHTDAAVMPTIPRCWSSWNYRMARHANEGVEASTVYWINRLQRLPTRQNYFVSINGEDSLRPQKVLQRVRYEHPLFSCGAMRAQNELPDLNQRHSKVYF